MQGRLTRQAHQGPTCAVGGEEKQLEVGIVIRDGASDGAAMAADSGGADSAVEKLTRADLCGRWQEEATGGGDRRWGRSFG